MRVEVPGPRRSLTVAVFGAALLLALWAVYRVAFDAPFYFDSRAHLVDRANLHMTAFTWQAVVDAVHLGFDGKLYRPLPTLTLALTHFFFGLDPRAYRAGNVAIHWAASLSALFLFTSILATARVRMLTPAVCRWALPAALVATGLWSLHPIQTNAVTYVIQRMASLCGLFSFLAVGAYLRGRSAANGWSWPWALLAGTAFVLALASKENALTLVLVMPIAEWTLLEPLPSERVRRRLRLVAFSLGFVGLAIVVWQREAIWHVLQSGYRLRDFSMGERLLTELRLQPRYLMLLLVPDPRLLTLDAEVEVSRSLFSPATTAASVALAGLALTLAFLARRRGPLLSFAILWFFATQAAESTILPLELYYEHRMYVPSALVYLCGSAAVASWLWRRPSRARSAAVALLAVGALGAEAWGTRSRNQLWTDPVAFWGDAVAKAPRRQRCRSNLGEALAAEGKCAEAEKVLKAALQMPGTGTSRVLLNLAAVAHRQGDRGASRQYLERALEEGRKDRTGETVRLARRALAGTAFAEGKLVEAQAQLTPLLTEWPTDGEGWNLQGAVDLRRERLDDADRALRRALRYDPTSARVWSNLGALAFQRGDRTAARVAFARACALDPKDPRYRRNLDQVEAATSRSSRSSR